MADADRARRNRASLSDLVLRYVPILSWARDYDRGNFRWDLLAGVTVGALLIPESMAYAQLAGLPPVAGLYAATIPLIAYGLLGTSRQLQFGPSSTIAIMSLAAVTPLADGDPARFAALSALLALMVGSVLLIAGIARLGFVASFLSEPILMGFKAGAALIVISGQLPKLFGIEPAHGEFFEKIWGLLTDLGETNGWTLALGLAAGAAIIVVERLRPLWPAALVVVLGSILLMNVSNLEDRGVHVAGDIPTGFPAMAWPAGISGGDILSLYPLALAIALVAYVEGIAMARSFATQNGYRINPDQELIAVGGGNVAAGLFQGFVVDGSISRSSVNANAGARTQVAGLVTALVVTITVVALAFIFEKLPEAVLAAIIITAVMHMLDVAQLKRIRSINPTEAWMYVITLVGVVTVGIAEGIVIAGVLSLLLLVWRVTNPHVAILGRLPDGESFRDVEVWDESETYPGRVDRTY